MNRYKVVGYLRLDPEGAWTSLADVKATVEALQADNRTYINERHENMKQLEELRQQVEALQRERGNERALHVVRRDAWWQSIKELEAALDAEREKVKVEQEQLEIQAREGGRLKDQLTQLQALVRALPIVTGKLEVDCGACYYVRALDGKENPVVCGLMTEQATAFAIKALLAYRATLDAMTPESANGQCQECGGEGVVDSGGVSQFDQPIMIPCGCLPERRRR